MGVPEGPWYIDDLLVFTVVTHRFDTGALTDADAVPPYRIYEDETGTAILTGNTAKLDDTNTTGFYSEQITLSAANGFEVGKSYSIYVTATVNSVVGGETFNFKVIATPPTAVDNADTLLNRDMSTGTDSGSTTVRTVRQALRALRNKVSITAGTLTVTKEDDSTSSWTAAVTGTPGADPVTAIDPAGP